MKLNKKELIPPIIMGLCAAFFGILTISGILLEKEVSTCIIFGGVSLILIILMIINFYFAYWYIQIEEIPLTEFEENLFKNKYILVHKATRMAFDIPMSVMDMLDLTTVRIRNNYNYKKKIESVELNIFDQKRK